MYLSADRLEILRERVMLFDDFSDDEILHLLQFAQKKGSLPMIFSSMNATTPAIFIS